MTIDNLTKSQVVRLKGRLFTITVVQLLQVDLYEFEKQLEFLVNQAPKLFYKIPVVLECSSLEDEIISLLPYFAIFKKFNLFPIGVQGTQSWLVKLANLQQIPFFSHLRLMIKPLTSTKRKNPLEYLTHP